MASDNALNLVNQIFIDTGDNAVVASVVGTPANIADRAIHFLNFTLKDLCRKIDFPILQAGFIAVAADSITNVYVSSIVESRSFSSVTCTVNATVLTEISRKALHEMRIQNQEQGIPKYFCRVAGTANELGVDIYPTPTTGDSIEVLSMQEPTLFTVSDTSTTEIAENDLLVLGAMAHMDAYTGMERGYMQLYVTEKNSLWTRMHSNEQFRIQTEDYR